MAPRYLVLPGVLAASLVSSCGEPLGTYTVEGVSLVPTMTLAMGGRDPGYGQYFHIDLTSETDLSSPEIAKTTIYAHADFCPVRQRYGLVTFGPGDAGDREVPYSDPAARMRPDSAGRYHYRVYIVAAHPMPGVTYSASWADQQRYDLRTAERDVCIRLHAPGYNIIPSQSRIVRVPARMFVDAARAVDHEPAPRSSSERPRRER